MHFLTVLLSFCLNAHADLYTGPISSAMGGTGRAAMDAAEGGFLNPALTPLVKQYEIDAFYEDGTLDPSQHHIAAGLGAADNSPGVLFPAEAHYVLLRNTGLTNTPANGELWHVATGQALMQGHFAWGFSVYRLTYTGLAMPTTVQWNYSLGTLFMITPDIGVAYVLNNLAKPGSDVPQGLRQDLQQALGFFAGVSDVLRIRVDVTRNEVFNPNKGMVYMLGLESLAGSNFIMRLGYRYDDQELQNYMTAGLCYNGPRLKVDYSFEKNLVGTSGALHGVDIRVPF